MGKFVRMIAIAAIIGVGFFGCTEAEFPVLTGTVSISGTAQVGHTLTANTSALGGNGDISYQWMRGGTTVGFNSGIYTVMAADAGSVITVIVTRSGNLGSVTSNPTAVVTSSVLPALTGTVTITGTAQEGQTLTAITTGLGGSGTISYQWMRDGNTVIGDESSYNLYAADVGSTITVTVTRSGNSGSVTSAPTAVVTSSGLPALTGTVTITGTAQEGKTLTANTGSIGGTGTIFYHWMRGSNNIGSNSSTYVVQADDVGNTITVTVSRTGNSGMVTSNPTPVIISAVAATPVASPPAGTYTTAQTVTLTTATSDAVIHYTINGSNPTASSSIYTVPIVISTNTTLKAIAVRSDMANSSMLEAVYNIGFSVTFHSNGGTPAPTSPITMNPGSIITQPPTMTKNWHTFGGWFMDSDFSVSAVFPITVNANVNLYAKWNVNTLTSVTAVNSYLASLPTNTSNNPVNLPVSFNLGTMTEASSGWRQLLDAISASGKYVNLDISACTMSGNTFNPVSSVATGKDRIVSLALPIIATDISNGTSSNPTFRNFNNLKLISGEYVITIGDYSFSRAGILGTYPILHTVNFPRATNIGDNAFSRCTSLQNVNIPQATSIGGMAFYGCTSLQSVNFPQVKTIGIYAFAYCSGLQSLSFPQATSITGQAFQDCTNLQSISFPASVTLAGFLDAPNPFEGCISLTSITLSGTGSLSVIESGKALVRNGNELIGYPSASGNITLGSSITTIAGGAFKNCTGLHSVNSLYVTIIGGSAFSGCTALQSASFSQVTHISYNDTANATSGAFSGCTSLRSLNIPKVTNIGSSTFGFTGSTTLSITMGSVAPKLVSEMFRFTNETKMVEIKIPVGATGYNPASSPFNGTPIMVSGTNTAANWANGFRGGGWDGTTWMDDFLNPGGTSKINQNINIFIQQ